MKKSEEKEGEEGVQDTVEEVGPQGEDDDGAVGHSNQTQNQHHHKVAQELESGA